jgi:hypothetical protein
MVLYEVFMVDVETGMVVDPQVWYVIADDEREAERIAVSDSEMPRRGRPVTSFKWLVRRIGDV